MLKDVDEVCDEELKKVFDEEEMAEEDILIRCEIFKLMHIPGKGFIKQVFYGEKPYVPKGVSATDMPDIITLIKAMPTDHFVEN